MLIDPDKAVAKKRQRKQEMGNDDRGFLFLTKLRVITIEMGEVTQLAYTSYWRRPDATWGRVYKWEFGATIEMDG